MLYIYSTPVGQASTPARPLVFREGGARKNHANPRTGRETCPTQAPTNLRGGVWYPTRHGRVGKALGTWEEEAVSKQKSDNFDTAPAPRVSGRWPEWGADLMQAATGVAPSQAGMARKALEMAELARQRIEPLPWGYDESSFVGELQAGSEAAFDLLVTHYHGPVYSLLYGMLNDAADASDVTQEVFLKAFRGIRSFRGSSSLKTWLYRIAVREALNHRRWSWRHLRQQFSIDAETTGEEGQAQRAALQLEDRGPSPFDSMAAQEMQDVVHRALAQVPAVFRSAVILRDLEGLAYEEVAEVLEVSVGTVKSRILRGRAALREILEPLWIATREQHAHYSRHAEMNTLQPIGGLRPDVIHGGGE